jgi:tetratricopeptide (TPR) repeat protein
MVEETAKDRPYAATGMKTGADEARAWLAFAEAKNEEAIGLLRPLANKQDVLGKGEVEIPARELLADMLLEMDRPQEALMEYERSLKTDPNRFNGLYGAGRAAELAHEPEKARTFYAQLIKNCGDSTERPELAKARTELAEK